MKFGLTVLSALLLASNLAFAQTDLATLERRVRDAEAASTRANSTADARELEEIRDDLGYLRVKTRRGETVTNRDRQDLNSRLDRFMSRVGASSSTYDPRRNRDRDLGQNRDRDLGQAGARTIPSGSELD